MTAFLSFMFNLEGHVFHLSVPINLNKLSISEGVFHGGELVDGMIDMNINTYVNYHPKDMRIVPIEFKEYSDFLLDVFEKINVFLAEEKYECISSDS